MTDFKQNTIVFDRANNPLPPDKASQVKLFLASDGKLKILFFDGHIEELVKAPQVTNKITEVTNTVINPDTQAIKALEETLIALINSKETNVNEAIKDVLSVINSKEASQLLANGVFDSAIQSIEAQVSKLTVDLNNALNDTSLKTQIEENIKLLQSQIDSLKTLDEVTLRDLKALDQANKSSLGALATDIVTQANNLNVLTNSQIATTSLVDLLIADLGRFTKLFDKQLELKASKGDLRNLGDSLSARIDSLPQVTVVADSKNVTVTKRDNEYGIAVDLPKIIEQVGGISKSAVIKLIDEYASTTLESSGGTVLITPIEGGYNLEVVGLEPVALSILSFTGGSVNEIGEEIPSVTLNWTYNKDVTSQSINQGIGALPPEDRTFDFNTPVTSDTTFTLSASDGSGSDSANTSITFISRVYWGETTSDVELLEADVKAQDEELKATRGKSITFNCTGGNRIFYAYPKSYGLATVRDGNGNKFTDWLLGTAPYEVSITNAPGYTQLYYVYHSNNIYNSSIVEFTWS